MLKAPRCDPLELETGSFHTWGGNYKGFLMLLAVHVPSRAVRVSRASLQPAHCCQPRWANAPLLYIPHESLDSLPEALLLKVAQHFL